MCVCMSSLQRWSIRLLVGLADPYNHTYSESLWWKLFKNHQRTQIQRQRQWQRQRQRQRHRKSAWNTHLMLYFWNPDDSLIPNMMIDTSPWSPWLPYCSHTFSSTGPSVSPFWDFWYRSPTWVLLLFPQKRFPRSYLGNIMRLICWHPFEEVVSGAIQRWRGPSWITFGLDEQAIK